MISSIRHHIHRLSHLFLTFAIALTMGNTHAFSAVAHIKDHIFGSWSRANNYASQKEADQAAIESCRNAARQNKIGHLANQCKVVTRSESPGYGAIVCGDDGCGWVLGVESGQDAVDGAFNQCDRNFKNCESKNIKFWEDFEGFTPSRVANASGGDCRPKTNQLSCKSSCTNGDCEVTYENGCKVRVQVSPRFDGFQNRWVYPSPSC